MLGTLFGLSAYCLYASFLYLSSGVACTLLFVYPAMVVLLTLSIRAVGSTAAAVFSSLHPLLAVGIGCAVFHEPFCARYALGMALIEGGITAMVCRAR